MSIVELAYGSCSATFCLLIVLALLQGRVSGVGLALVGASALTAIWAAAMAIPMAATDSVSHLLDSLRLSAWLILMVGLVGLRATRQIHTSSLPFRLAVVFSVLLVGYEVIVLVKYGTSHADVLRLRYFLRIGCGIAGLLAIENLWRNADDIRRRDIWPFCLAMAAMFAFELFLYADRLMLPEAGSDTAVAAGRGLVGVLAVPMLALAMARNRAWQVNIHVSRTVVLHTLTLMASGVFLLVLAAAGALVRSVNGRWGPSLQLFTLLGSVAVLVPIFGSHSIRVHLKRLVSRHFFSHRFDYRAEWLRFVETVSRPSETGEELPRRVVKALAQIVDSPSGTLWRLDGQAFVCEVGWNMPSEAERKISAASPFMEGFRGGNWIQHRDEVPKDGWPFEIGRAWLAVPLSYGGETIGFVVLASPLGISPVDWETYDLLRAAGRQAASYLAEERSTRELVDARLLNEYSKKFAFVMHDLKNMASQLTLVVANAHRHMDDEDFRRDMLVTLEASVAKMNRLLEQLRGEGVPTSAMVIEPDRLIEDLVANLAKLGKHVGTRLAARYGRIAIDPEQFRSILSHLINNAHDAAQGGSVIVASRCASGSIVIDVVDDGPGMDQGFIRDELFRPFRSTKASGYGIGAYQTRELLRASGGELEVISKNGAGTTMRVTLPLQEAVGREAEIA